MTPEKQDRLVRILEGSMAEAERMQQSEDEAVRLKGAMLGESLNRAGGLLVSLQLRDEHHAADHNQKERHHADDVARGAGEGSKNLTIVLAGADGQRLLRPPEPKT